jgi:adenylate cyclase class 2
MIEQEVKLSFPHIEAARQAVTAAGARLVVSRRLLDDRLYDTVDARLRQSGRALRIRREPDRGFVTFKGPVLAGPVKAREELETSVGDPRIADKLLEHLGYHPVFRSQKYREEYALDAAHIAIDEAPVGVFVEIEAAPEEIARVTLLLGRTPRDYQLDSYVTLWRRRCSALGLALTDMLFDARELPAS